MPRASKVIPKEGVNGAGHVRLALYVSPEHKRWLMLRAVEAGTTVSAVVAALVESAREPDTQTDRQGG
jgi:hypothetical protein